MSLFIIESRHPLDIDRRPVKAITFMCISSDGTKDSLICRSQHHRTKLASTVNRLKKMSGLVNNVIMSMNLKDKTNTTSILKMIIIHRSLTINSNSIMIKTSHIREPKIISIQAKEISSHMICRRISTMTTVWNREMQKKAPQW